MTSQPIPKYHIAPNFSIPPVEAGGILQLGSIISDIASADEPLNDDCVAPIPLAELFCGHQMGFTATTSRMIDGEYGVWAKCIGIGGIGGELSLAHQRSAEDVYNLRGVDTIYFNPSQKYLDESMGQQDVKDYIVGSGYAPVYMVTGLKTARGPSVKISKGRKVGGTAELGLHSPGVIPVELGPKLNSSKEERQEMGFEDSTDFIIGIRVKKLVYKRHWLTRKIGQLVTKEHNKGATMVDDDVVKKGFDEVLQLDNDEEEGEAEVEVEQDNNEFPGTAWVLQRA